MKIIVGQHKLEIVKEPVNEREIDISKCEFEFDEAITSEYVKEAYFTLEGNTYKQIILNDECDIPSEVLVKKGTVEIGVVAFLVENEEEIKRYNPSPAYFNTWVGSLKDNAENSEPVTPTDKEQMEQALQDGLNDIDDKLGEVDDKMLVVDGKIEDIDTAITQTNNLNIDVNKVDKTTQVDLTKKDGTTKTVYINDGTSLQFMWQGTSLGIKTDDMEEYVFVNLQGIQGQPGPQGEPFRIKKEYASVAEMNADFDNMNVGDYVMIASTVEVEDNAKLYVKGDSQWIFITDFSGAQGIKGETGATPIIRIGTVTSGSTPSVTISGTEEEPVFNFVLQPGEQGRTGETGATGPTGNGIASIVKTASAGLIDTYTITFTDGTTTTFNVTNGQDGDVTQEYVDEENERLKSIFNVLPKVSDSGESVELENTGDTMLYKMDLKGNTSQEVIQGEVGLEEEDTSIYVDDVNEDKENYITLKGNTYQDSTSGKNLYEGSQNFSGTWTNQGNWETDSSTYNGLVVKKRKAAWQGLSKTINVEAGKTYTYSLFIKSDSARSVAIYTDGGTATISPANKNITTTTSWAKYSLTFTCSASGTIKARLENTTASDSNYTYICGYQLEEGDTATSYEKYTGGITSPNPDYPQEIEVVTGLNNIVISNDDNTENTTYEVNLGSIELCKIGTYQDKIYKSNGNWYLHKEIGKIVLDGSEENLTRNQYKLLYQLPITNIMRLPNASTTGNVMSNNFTATSPNDIWNNDITGITNLDNADMIRIRFQGDVYSTLEAFKTWLSTHNTIVYYVLATPTDTQITDTTLISQLNALYNATIYSTTHINTETSNLLPYINLKYNVVTASPSPDRASEVEVVKGNNTITISNEDGTKTQSYNITLGNLELCKIGDYQDYFYKDNGNWYKYGAIGKVVLNGSEEWSLPSSISGNITQFEYTPISIGKYLNNNTITAIANYFRGVGYTGNTDGNSWAIDKSIVIAYGGKIRIMNSLFTTATEFKDWLSTHNTTCYYVLATPTTTQITDQLLVSQLDELQKAMSYYDKTIITQTNADKPFILDVIGIRDLQDIFNI